MHSAVIPAGMVCRILGTGLVLVLGSLTAGASTLEPARLRCENLDNPPAIDVVQPRLSWIVESDHRGARQSSYRVLVAGSQQELASGSGGLWDSGQVADDVYQFDLGQNVAGWCWLRLRGKPGQEIILRHFESLDGQGRGNPATIFGARAAEHYICRGDPQGEVCEPHFTYHGFRHVEISGLGYEPAVGDLVGRVVCSDAAQTGGFDSSHDVANKLMHAALWTQMGNMVSVPTDCPQRIERLGWMGDIQAFAPTAMYHMNMSAFFAKWLADIRGAQFTNGAFTAISPYHFLGSWNDPITVVNSYYGPFAAAPGWSDAGAIIPYWDWIYYGDRRVLEENFDSTHRWVDYIHNCNPDTLIFRKGRGEEYGDWLPAGPKLESDLFATAFFARSTECVAKLARALGRTEDARRYSELFDHIRAAIQQTFINADASMKSVNPIAGIALGLNFDLYAEAQRAKAAQQMVSAIAGKPLPTGIQTSHRVMLELTRNEYHDAACRIMSLHAAPSWGYMMDQGATTIWENWQGTGSQNHFALDSIETGAWGKINLTDGVLTTVSPAESTVIK
jgi:alpha-L-rhamnosidase